jgi:hypothetical protein
LTTEDVALPYLVVGAVVLLPNIWGLHECCGMGAGIENQALMLQNLTIH